METITFSFEEESTAIFVKKKYEEVVSSFSLYVLGFPYVGAKAFATKEPKDVCFSVKTPEEIFRVQQLVARCYFETIIEKEKERLILKEGEAKALYHHFCFLEVEKELLIKELTTLIVFSMLQTTVWKEKVFQRFFASDWNQLLQEQYRQTNYSLQYVSEDKEEEELINLDVSTIQKIEEQKKERELEMISFDSFYAHPITWEVLQKEWALPKKETYDLTYDFTGNSDGFYIDEQFISYAQFIEAFMFADEFQSPISPALYHYLFTYTVFLFVCAHVPVREIRSKHISQADLNRIIEIYEENEVTLQSLFDEE